MMIGTVGSTGGVAGVVAVGVGVSGGVTDPMRLKIRF